MPHVFDLHKKDRWGRTGHHLHSTERKIYDAVYTMLDDLKIECWHSKEPLPFSKRTQGKKKKVQVGKVWGKDFECAWFRFSGKIPTSVKGQAVLARIDLGGEGCVFDKDGVPTLGLTSKGSGGLGEMYRRGKVEVPLVNRAKGGEPVELWVDAGANNLFGIGGGFESELYEARLAVCHPEMKALFFDYTFLHEFARELPEDSARRHQVLGALFDAATVLRDMTESEAKQARNILAPQLKMKNGDVPLSVSAIGHAHLDLAWLWPERESYRKGARTFATALAMMERYPDYVFGASQPQLYQWIKDQHPAVYAKIKQRVKQKRWEPQGAMWVESDTNVPSGESLIRQVLHGKRFHKEEFGLDVQMLFLPDVFGYSGALPQILKKSGVPYFMTQKLSWSTFNEFPHHTFHWEGIDGSRVLSHMLPEDNYNSGASPQWLVKGETKFHDKIVSDRYLMLYGIGDGGGGPGEEHLEALSREKNLQSLPPVTQEWSIDFFKKIEKNADRYAIWKGELYLEQHRGTYTSQARCKWYNRKLEFALRDLERTAGLAAHLTGFRYPHKELDAIWKEMLLYQFHDILPGSSIKRVYDEVLARYKVLMEQVLALAADAAAAMTKKIDTAGVKNPLLVTNGLSWERTEWVPVGRKWFKVTVPPLGHVVVDGSSSSTIEDKPKATRTSLENGCLRVRFNKDGSLASVYDKVNKHEALARGEAGNRLAVWDDTSDAWNIEQDYEHKPPEHFTLQKSTAHVDGPRAFVRQTYTYKDSKIVQEVTLTAGSPRLDFVTEVDWKTSNKMLRTSFPTSVTARDATCEIQFGHLTRPTHRNTSWDAAKYEICAQRWIDMSQPDYGVALLNDCKYGHKAKDHVLDLNLLRGTGHPGKEGDIAKHRIVYSLLPHAGDFRDGNVIREGYQLNVPLQAAPVKAGRGSVPARHSFLSVDAENVIVETVKQAEDGKGLIVRLYEAHGADADATLTLGIHAGKAEETDLMETRLRALTVRGGKIKLRFTPFEIKTVRLRA